MQASSSFPPEVARWASVLLLAIAWFARIKTVGPISLGVARMTCDAGRRHSHRVFLHSGPKRHGMGKGVTCLVCRTRQHTPVAFALSMHANLQTQEFSFNHLHARSLGLRILLHFIVLRNYPSEDSADSGAQRCPGF